jgi:hypothetical protein
VVCFVHSGLGKVDLTLHRLEFLRYLRVERRLLVVALEAERGYVVEAIEDLV